MNDFIIAADEVGRGWRESLYGLLTTHPDISWSLVSRSVADIDRMGIDKATTEAFIQAVQELQPHQVPEGKKLLIKIDGRPIWAENKFDHKTVFITHGDATEWEIGAASIIAKVARDRYMDKLSVSHPEYKWEKNKGYGTADHIEAIRKHGLTPYHRKTFCRNYMTSAPVLEAQRELDDVLSMFK